MYQPPLIPLTKERKEAECLIQTLQSERIVEDGRIRVLSEALEFYAYGAGHGPERARRALKIAGAAIGDWDRYRITEEVSRNLPTDDGS